ncbi:hypothetical protein [Stenotrophomonas daejeonensis]|uniref:hypothetical protein n=1 Tax=Stenotrophomonas daejeonensis TaxID=659018 RepID=UPI000B24F561|nr:hypothetical protein [Stenotrophomonas daejeonensis]
MKPIDPRIAPFSTRKLFLVLIPLLALSCANARTSPPPVHPPATKEELQQRLLRFADSLHKRADAEAEQFAAALGISLIPIENTSKHYKAVSQPLAGGYLFAVSSLHGTKDFTMNSIWVFPPDGQDPVRAIDPPCIWDAADFSRQLRAIGFNPWEGETSPHGAPFQGGRIWPHLRLIDNDGHGVTASLLIYDVGPTNASRECVYGMRFAGGEV